MSAPRIPWTRLEGSPLWHAAAAAHGVPGWRIFQDFGHPVTLYRQAAGVFQLPYCPDLDAAILLHDVIHDAEPQAERRSAEWARRQGCGDKVVDLILSTETHAPCDDNRLILLDLSNLMNGMSRRAGTEAIRREYLARRGTDSGFEAGTIAYLAGLRGRILTGIASRTGLSACDRHGFESILGGISEAILELQSADPEP